MLKALASASSAMHPAFRILLTTTAILGGDTFTLAFAIFRNPSIGRRLFRRPSSVISAFQKDPESQSNHQMEPEEMDDQLFDEYCSVMDDFGCEAYEDVAQNLGGKVDRWIRVEAKPDESIAGITTREDVLRKIDQVRELQSQYGPSDLYPRIWEDKKDIPVPINGDKANTPSFSVLQFNALAEGLSSGPDVKTPFPVAKKDSEGGASAKNDAGYGGFTQVKCPEICLDFNLRRWRVLEVILGIGVKNDNPLDGFFDVIALEEIDRYRGFFAPLLRIFGYEGLFMPKQKAPGVALGYYSDGCALFWKTNTFDFVREDRLNYRVGNQVAILAELKHKSSGAHILVAITHLKAQKSMTNEKIRCSQVEELLGHIQAAVAERDIPVLIMGDFNADPPAHLSFDESSVGAVLSNHLFKDSEFTPLRLQSAYEIDPPSNDLFTTWKTRGTQTVKRIIDYIFYTEQLTCTSTFSVPKDDKLEAGKLPGLRYPSDHLMIAAKFCLLERKNC